jgi:hypothetical protein
MMNWSYHYQNLIVIRVSRVMQPDAADLERRREQPARNSAR